MTPTNGIDLDQYKTQAKDILKLFLAGNPQALERLRTHHPEHEKLIASGRLQLADAQLVIARENGFASWAKFKDYLLFANAVRALDAGDVEKLSALLDEHPSLLKYRCHTGKCSGQGYFAGAMLLHHVAGNPIRCPLPKNIVEIARLLIARGADPKAETEGGWTTIGLILTGGQASDAGVDVLLIDLLEAAGATEEYLAKTDLLFYANLERMRSTAEELVRRGVKMDIRHAVALGRMDLLEDLLKVRVDNKLLEEALYFACVQNEEAAVRALVARGAKGDVIFPGNGVASALHNAAWRGHTNIVQILLEHGANPSIIEPTYNATPAGWAEHRGHNELADLLRRHER